MGKPEGSGPKLPADVLVLAAAAGPVRANMATVNAATSTAPTGLQVRGRALGPNDVVGPTGPGPGPGPREAVGIAGDDSAQAAVGGPGGPRLHRGRLMNAVFTVGRGPTAPSPASTAIERTVARGLPHSRPG